ncbi:UNVERIFIED_CONTAM: hypothetical protein Slati_4043800 [Sesamum latifolium]|uniref:Reverse transcriptase zinc-binding domain-containing protein n=1 Tax=Sesamum latifolium TaxID=2727402 RepID=A0AAW2TS63_9LAMI
MFCNAEERSVVIFKEALTEFSLHAGLVANPGKSQIIISKSATHLQHTLCVVLGFQLGSLPLKYLGIPLVSSRFTIHDCQPLIRKLEQRIATWGSNSMSYAARLQLIKSVLYALFYYWGQAFILPKESSRRLKISCAVSFGKGMKTEDVQKFHGTQLCTPTENGGLRLRHIDGINQALMMHHLWDLITHNDASLWIENGAGTYLWEDPWHPLGVLIHRFPSITRTIGIPQRTKVHYLLSHREWTWPSSMRCEIAEITDSLPPLQGIVDMLAIQGKLATADTPWLILSTRICILCDDIILETHDHLFFQCRYSRQCLRILKQCDSSGRVSLGILAYFGLVKSGGNLENSVESLLVELGLSSSFTVVALYLLTIYAIYLSPNIKGDITDRVMTALGHCGDLAKFVVELQKLLNKSRAEKEYWKEETMRWDLRCRERTGKIVELEGKLKEQKQAGKAQVEQLQAEIRDLRHNKQSLH